MSQNRPDLIKRFVGVASNTIVHKILVKTELEEEIRQYYTKEIGRDVEIALKYRNKINPIDKTLPQKDIEEIRIKILSKVNSELSKRKEKGYNIDFSLARGEIDSFLKDSKVI